MTVSKKKKSLTPKPVIADIAKILADAARRLIVVRNPQAGHRRYCQDTCRCRETADRCPESKCCKLKHIVTRDLLLQE